MNKKQFIAPLSVFCVSAVMLSTAGCSVSEVKKDVGNSFKEWISEIADNADNAAVIAESGENNGIRLMAATYTLTNETSQGITVGDNYDYSEDSAYNSARITASAEDNSPVPLTGATWKVAFADKTIGGNASDYVSLIPVTADGLTVQVNVKKFSAHEIIITAVSKDNSNVTGNISLHFVNRISSLTVSAPTVSLVSEKEYAVSINGVVNSGTLNSEVSFARYVKFSSAFSDDSETYYPISRTMTGAAWKTFLTEHVKDETALATMLASDGGNDGYVAIYCTVTVSYNGKIYQFMTSEAFYPKFTNNEILSGSVTVGGNTTVITPSDNVTGDEDNTGSGTGNTDNPPSYIETEDNSISIGVSGGDGDYTVTVDEKLQDKVTVDITDGTITITNNTDNSVAGTVTINSGNQTVEIPVAFIKELTASVTEIDLVDPDGSSTEITLTGGTGEYIVEVSGSLRGCVTVTQNGNKVVLTYSGIDGYCDQSGTITIRSGNQTITINVRLTTSWVSCLTGDSLILMSDGMQKRIDSLSVGEKVLSFNPATMQLEADEITYSDSKENKRHTEYDIWTFSDGTQVKTVRRHRLYNMDRQAMVNMDEWHIGERAYSHNGYVTLVAHENVKEIVNHYTIFTKNQNYFVNGLLSGNKHTKAMSL